MATNKPTISNTPQGARNCWVADALESIEANRSLNAFVSTFSPSDCAAADDSQPLFRVPFAVKDNIDVEGVATTGGVSALLDNKPNQTAQIIKRLEQAGAVLVGKTNMHELAAGITSNNGFLGAVKNPNNPELIAGGSSGGSAAAVGAGIVPFALGTDTAGSCRIPAALCGCVGFRPSLDRYPMQGVLPLCRTRDTIGLFANSVQDIQLLDEICSDRQQAAAQVELAALRLGVPKQMFVNLEQAMIPIIDSALKRLADAGVTLIDVEITSFEQIVSQLSMVLLAYEAPRDIAMYLAMHGSSVRLIDIVESAQDPMVKMTLMSQMGEQALSPSLYRSVLTDLRPKLIAVYESVFRDHKLDALVFPTTPLTARPIGQDKTVELNGKKVSTTQTFMRNTEPASLTGMPSISLPIGETADGNCVGLCLDSLANTDAQLLAIAESIDSVLEVGE